jgi:hypothetical protein
MYRVVKIMLLCICCMTLQVFTLTTPSFRTYCSGQSTQLLENKTDQTAYFVFFL